MNRLLAQLCLPLALASWSAGAWADDHHHRHHRKDHKEEYWDGHCKVERKWKKNGEYKEKRKCRDRPVAYHQPQPVYVAPPQPVYVAPPQVVVPRPARPEVVISPQIVIRP